MTVEIDIDDVARLTGEPVSALREWQARGLLSERGLSLRDAELARLIRALERRGLPPKTIDDAVRDHRGLIESFLDMLTPTDVAIGTALDSPAAESGVAADVIERIAVAGGLEEARVASTPDDLAALAVIPKALASGFPEDALLQLLRVYADTFERIADAEVRLFHLHVHRALRASGLESVELMEATNAVSASMQELVDPTLLYFHRKAFTRAMRQDFVLHMLEELGLEESDSSEGRLWRAVLFVDLSQFTPLTDAMGDVTAAGILERFARHVREVTRSLGGTVVKQIGDGFLTVFLETSSAVTAALELNRRIEREPHFPAMHAGVHFGAVLYREGDYLGTTVNLAARLVSEAGPCEVIVSADARHSAGALPAASFAALGMRPVKGLDRPIELYRADPSDREPTRRLTDPVCGMQLGDEEAAARVTVGGENYVFCSIACLTRFTSRTAAVADADSNVPAAMFDDA